MNAEPTLTEALAAAGYTHVEGRHAGKRAILRDGVEVFHGRAWEASEWLRAQGIDDERLGQWRANALPVDRSALDGGAK